MRIELQKQRGIRGKELLGGESPVRIDFDPERDLTSAQVISLFDRLDESKESRDWVSYEGLYLMLSTLWPEMKGRELVSAPSTEVEKKLRVMIGANRSDLYMRAIAQRRILGFQADVFLQPDLVKEYLNQFDRQCRMESDFFLPEEALSIIRLGLRSLKEVFLDREETWKRSQVLLQSFHSTDLGLYAQLVVELKVLFPEHADEIRMESGDISQLKQNLLRIDSKAHLKVVETAYYLKLVTAGRIELGPQGQYVVSSSPLTTPPELPDRDIT